MIYEVEGDILLTRTQLVVHNATTFDPMNRGIARDKVKYPAARHFICGVGKPVPSVHIWRWEASDHADDCLITQEGDEDPTRIRRLIKVRCTAVCAALPKELQRRG